MGEKLIQKKIVWNILLAVVVIALFLGNFTYIGMATDQEENNVILEKISCLISEEKLGNETYTTSSWTWDSGYYS